MDPQTLSGSWLPRYHHLQEAIQLSASHLRPTRDDAQMLSGFRLHLLEDLYKKIDLGPALESPSSSAIDRGLIDLSFHQEKGRSRMDSNTLHSSKLSKCDDVQHQAYSQATPKEVTQVGRYNSIPPLPPTYTKSRESRYRWNGWRSRRRW